MTGRQWYAMAAVDESFLTSAPARHEVSALIAASRIDVWNAFADASSWQYWWPGVKSVVYEGTAPHGIGTIRKSCVQGEHFDETLLIWQPPSRWGYRIDRSTLELARAQIELTEFDDVPEGTRVRWIIASDPLQGFQQIADGSDFKAFLQGLLEDAMQGLLAYLQQVTQHPT